MISYEKKLFNHIKSKLPSNISFTEEIADILDINYDAAYRRIKGKTTLTLKESLLLSKHFDFNLNDICLDKDEFDRKKITVEKTHPIISNDILKLFFEKSKIESQYVLNSKNGQIFNCAKDFPFYHTDNGFLMRFRLFVFSNMLTKNQELKKVTFSNFNPSSSLVEKYEEFLNQYQKVPLVEVWNDSTIDNVLNQIQHFFEIGLTTSKESSSIFDGLKITLKSIENQAKNKKREHSNNTFQLYHNNLISLLNTIIKNSDVEKSVFVPYTNLTYFKVTDKNTTHQIEAYLKTQLEFSNNLSGEASIERSKFFSAMHLKIEKRKLKLLL